MTGLEGVDCSRRSTPPVAATTRTPTRSRARPGSSASCRRDATNNTDLDNTIHFDGGTPRSSITAGPRDTANTRLKQPTGTDTDHLAFFVDSSNDSIDAHQNGHVSRRSLAAGSGHEDGHDVKSIRDITSNADVTILSGRSPYLEIDSLGRITKAIETAVCDQAACTSFHSNTTFQTTGTIIVKDIVNPGPGKVVFRAPAQGNSGDSSTTITGSGGTWTFRDTLSSVRIINNSATQDIQINDIRVASAAKPVVRLESDDDTHVPLTFHIAREAAPTLVWIQNSTNRAIEINGTIDNPIGTTVIENTLGNVRSSHDRLTSDGITTSPARASSCGGADAGESLPGGGTFTADGGHYALICTNILDIQTPGGSVGSSSTRLNISYVDAQLAPSNVTLPIGFDFTTGRVNNATGEIFLGPNPFFTGQLVLYSTSGTALGGLTSGDRYTVVAVDDGLRIKLRDGNGNLIAITQGSSSATTTHTLTPVTRFDVEASVDIYLDIRGQKRFGGDYVVTIDHVFAGGNVDLLLRTSVSQSGSGQGGGITIHWPDAFADARTTATSRARAQRRISPAGVFGTGSTRDRQHLRLPPPRQLGQPDAAGPDGGRATSSSRPSTGRTSRPTTGSTSSAITEIHGTGGDLEGAGHIDVLTNGWIGTARQPVPGAHENFRVGTIESADDDVFLIAAEEDHRRAERRRSRRDRREHLDDRRHRPADRRHRDARRTSSRSTSTGTTAPAR